MIPENPPGFKVRFLHCFITAIPIENGATSVTIRPLFDNAPDFILACTAAPNTTASSGSISFLGFLLKRFEINSYILGIFVEPPTRSISSISVILSSASFSCKSSNYKKQLTLIGLAAHFFIFGIIYIVSSNVLRPIPTSYLYPSLINVLSIAAIVE